MAEEAPQDATPADAPPADAPPAPAGPQVSIDPPAIQVPATGGSATMQFQNGDPMTRFCYKIKCTNNDHYRVYPVFGFLEPGAAAQVDVTRLTGPPKNDDRLEILFMTVDAAVIDPKAVYSANAKPDFKLEEPMSAV